jgi:hypothetical protein
MGESDAELVARALSGQRAAFAELVRRHVRWVGAVAAGRPRGGARRRLRELPPRVRLARQAARPPALPALALHDHAADGPRLAAEPAGVTADDGHRERGRGRAGAAPARPGRGPGPAAALPRESAAPGDRRVHLRGGRAGHRRPGRGRRGAPRPRRAGPGPPARRHPRRRSKMISHGGHREEQSGDHGSHGYHGSERRDEGERESQACKTSHLVSGFRPMSFSCSSLAFSSHIRVVRVIRG